MSGDPVTALLREMAERIATGAPRGWKRAELRGFATGPDGMGDRGLFFEPADPDGGTGEIDLFEPMTGLHTSVRADDTLTIELQVRARGQYRAVLSESLIRGYDDGFRYLLNTGSVPPEPDELATGPVALEAGDPAEAVALLGEYLSRLTEVLGPAESKPELPPALPESYRRTLLTEAGITLPRDLAALYSAVDGDGGHGLLHGHPWFGLEMLTELHAPEERWWVDRSWRRYDLEGSINEYGPPLAVRRLSDHPGWIPFATDTTGDYLAVDMAPGPGGRPGQVILIGRHHDDGPVYVAESVTALIRMQVDALATGAYEYDEDGDLWIQAGDLQRYRHEYEETTVLEVSGGNAAPIRGLRPEHRELKVRNAPWVELDQIRLAPTIRRVSLANCPGADLTPLRDVALELLDLSLAKIDLSGLRTHPTLRKLILRTEGEDDMRPSKKPYQEKRYTPVDLSPLLSCPLLYALDLTEANVQDLSVLANATGLRYLRMIRPQWEELFRANAIPPSLAVADLAREPSRTKKWYWSFDKATLKPRPDLDDATSWARKLTGAADIRELRGRFTARRPT